MDDKFIIYNNGISVFEIKKEYIVQGHTTFTVFVKANDFVGVHPFCMFSENIKNFLKELEDVDKTLSGEIKFCDNDSESFVLFKISKSEVISKGELGFYSGRNLLRFEQRLDQTIIRLLIDCFKNMLD